ncbi:hypothetical protein D3C85_1208000 [compost metagenome]
MGRPRFSVGEEVILCSIELPHLNGEYIIEQIVIPGTSVTCRATNKLLWYTDEPIGYLMTVPFTDPAALNSSGNMTELVVYESALRKKHQPGEFSFDQLMSSFKSPVNI